MKLWRKTSSIWPDIIEYGVNYTFSSKNNNLILCDGNGEMWHILHKRFITWAIIQYLVSNWGFKMDSSTSKDRTVYRGSSTRPQPYNMLILIISYRIASIVVCTRDGSIPKMCTSGGHQCKTVLIPGLHVLVHPRQHGCFLFTPLQ